MAVLFLVLFLVSCPISSLGEYLAKAAKDCVGSSETRQKSWTKEQQKRMKCGDIEVVQIELEPFRNHQTVTKRIPQKHATAIFATERGNLIIVQQKLPTCPSVLEK